MLDKSSYEELFNDNKDGDLLLFRFLANKPK
jgi:hypothetical protein